MLLEAVPVVIEGHHYQIECLASDGKRIVSVCLGMSEEHDNFVYHCSIFIFQEANLKFGTATQGNYNSTLIAKHIFLPMVKI